MDFLLEYCDFTSMSDIRAKTYVGRVMALLIDDNRINVRKNGTDRQMDGQTLDLCFTLSAMEAASC